VTSESSHVRRSASCRRGTSCSAAAAAALTRVRDAPLLQRIELVAQGIRVDEMTREPSAAFDASLF